MTLRVELDRIRVQMAEEWAWRHAASEPERETKERPEKKRTRRYTLKPVGYGHAGVYVGELQ